MTAYPDHCKVHTYKTLFGFWVYFFALAALFGHAQWHRRSLFWFCFWCLSHSLPTDNGADTGFSCLFFYALSQSLPTNVGRAIRFFLIVLALPALFAHLRWHRHSFLSCSLALAALFAHVHWHRYSLSSCFFYHYPAVPPRTFLHYFSSLACC